MHTLKLFSLQKKILSSCVLFLFFYIPHLKATPSTLNKNFFLFVINGDSQKQDYYTSCSNNKLSCSADQKIKKSFSQSLLKKAIRMSKICKNCDSLIIFMQPTIYKNTKPKTSKNLYSNNDFHSNDSFNTLEDSFHNPDFDRLENEPVTMKRRVLLYKSGIPIIDKSYSKNSNTNILNYIPTIGAIKTLFFTQFSFAKEVQFVKTVLSDTSYHKQLAFYIGHKLPEGNQRGSLASEPLTKFGIKTLINSFKKVSYALNKKKNRPFDALFLAQCASTVETVYEVYKSNVASLLVGTPEVIPLTGLADWDLNYLEKKLEQQKPLKTILTSWIKDLFNKKSPAGISHKILTDYTLSLYDMKKTQKTTALLSQAVSMLEKYNQEKREVKEELVFLDKNYNWGKEGNHSSSEEERKYNSEAISQGHYRAPHKTNTNNLLFLNKSFSYDCKKYPFLDTFMKQTKKNAIVFNMFQGRRSLLELLNNKKNQKVSTQQLKNLHSGWGCKVKGGSEPYGG